jgi:tetratricopeptide (TPR) repeat protein
MRVWDAFLKRVVAAVAVILLAACLPSAALAADDTKLDDLFSRLLTAQADEAARIEQEIWIEWSKSGSPAMDLLLQRGRDSMEAGDTETAIGHLTALTDHAPEFAEGWNARATAYFQAGNYGPSVADIERTLALNPRHFGAMSGFGMILEQAGQPERALVVYRAALAIHPHLAGVLESVERLEIELEGREL